MNDTIKIAIVGAGYMAQEHAKAFAALPGVAIVGVHSRTPARADDLARRYGARRFDSIVEMYEATKADVVIGAVPELSMPDVARQCFSHPWICLLEKPVGLNLAEAEALLQSSREQNATVYVALNRRSHSSTRQVLQELGDDPSPRIINVLDQQDMKVARDIGQPEPVVLNWMYANSIHLVDYLTFLGRGEIRKVDVVKPWTPNQPGLVVAGIHFASGDFGLYQAVWDGPGPWAVTVTTAKSRHEMRPLEKLTVQRRGERRFAEVPTDTVDTDFKPGLHFQAQRIVAGVHGEPVCLPTLEDATRSMRLVARIYGLDAISEQHVL
ncbi:Gfo/Idh/MocA family oxidoreductase [Pelomonas sp. P7]|uniref:Gfo/Idh/MocA family oxidoreductase n=1 Tax=Pelomonas caseinilytica TaxID=2906763 RepID=A0ABS8XHY4_9BURK|nr:Gfo/Idh/MocA family oxidoreductase [Pelomonas sp. P7]MCE4538168.1 Gfo/Idh/MocA family oxidoreductase [Pelomonas sp. P7]